MTYVEDPPGESALAAAGVFGEFADKMRGRAFTMVIAAPYVEPARTVLEEYGSPAGLTVHPLDGPVLDGLRDATLWERPSSRGSTANPTEVLSTVATNKGAEILLGSAAATVEAVTHLRSAGLRQTARVDLVDKSGAAESLVFGTASDKALEKFKDELWALDEYAGIRLRDPGDAEGTLLDIRVQPNLAPLRRALAARLAADGPATLAELRVWTVHETIFRQADATKALQAMVTAGGVARTPPGGRLAVDTVLALSDRLTAPDHRGRTRENRPPSTAERCRMIEPGTVVGERYRLDEPIDGPHDGWRASTRCLIGP